MLAWRLLLRDWRGGELGVLSIALIVAVTIVVGISAFAERLQSSIVSGSGEFLAADRVLESSREIDSRWLNHADNIGLRRAEIVSFQSMVMAGEAMSLASVKAVSAEYPLRGSLSIADKAFGEAYATDALPAPGEVWVDSRLLPMLALKLGDSLTVGDAALTITGIVTNEPDRGGNFFVMGPRVLMRVADLPATGVIQPGSRVTYRYLFSGADESLQAYADWLLPRMGPPHRWLDLRSSQPRIAQALDRAERYLLLAGALGVALAGVAIALASKRYAERHFDYVAMMKTLGAEGGAVMRMYCLKLLVVGFVCIVIGALCGYFVQQGLITLLRQYVAEVAPLHLTRPVVLGAVSALTCLLVFALPPLFSLRAVSPLRVLRRDLSPSVVGRVGSTVIGVFGVAALMWWYSGDLLLTAAVIAGVLLTVLLVALLAWVVLRGTRQAGMQAGSVWRLAFAGLQRRGEQNAVQVVIFSLSIMLLLVLVLVRGSLVEEWEMQLPVGTPNHFMINIAPDQVEPVKAALAGADVTSEGLYPMVRGRLTHIDGVPVNRRVSKEEGERADGRVDRELNLTWSETAPDYNEVVDGQWWTPGTADAVVSVESELAESMGIEKGDSLRFLIGNETLSAEVVNFREVDWDTMQPNFYMIFPKNVLGAFPGSYMTSFFLPRENKQFLNTLLREFPTLTVIEVDAVIAQIRSIIVQVALAIQLVLTLIVLCGVLVLVASVHASLDQRLHENAILRTLGARKTLVMGSLWIEFAVLGAIAGGFAAIAAELSVAVFQTQVLAMDYVPHPWVWWVGPLLGLVLVGGTGYAACRRVVLTPPLQVLREI